MQKQPPEIFYKKKVFLRPQACNFIKKKTLTQVFSCELCKIFKSTFFTENLRAIASGDGLSFYTKNVLSP